ncbi:MAG: ERF family protein [Vagococcus sp.]
MNIYEKLLTVRKTVPYLKKEQTGQQYKYVGSSDVLAAITDKLNELGLILITKVLSSNVLTRETTNAKGNVTAVYFTELNLEFTWVNAENPEETIVIPFYAQGVDTAGEKGVGKALTYGEKYFLLKQFNIATDKDDPDAFQQKQDSHKPQEMSDLKQQQQLHILANELSKFVNQSDQAILSSYGITGSTKDITKAVANDVINDLRKIIGQWKQTTGGQI